MPGASRRRGPHQGGQSPPSQPVVTAPVAGSASDNTAASSPALVPTPAMINSDNAVRALWSAAASEVPCTWVITLASSES